MTKKIYILFFILLSLTLSKSIIAQQYPVDCRILLAPPYSSNLGDYANSPMKFRVQLLLRDLSKPSLEVSLRIRLKGAGVWIENPADFISTQSIVLTPGVPKLLSGIELGENFASQNLEAQGIDINELYSGSPLPVGPYEWEVYAVELYRNRQVSNIGNARMSINYNYPPLLNTPQGLQMATQPQNLRFSWTPRHTASPTAAAGVVYTLYLYEIPEGEDPQMVVNSGLATYRTIETTQPYYNYDVSEIPLNIGKQYAWMVHVTDYEGKDTFVNNGYSEIKTFQYGKAKCGIPTNLISQIEADGAVKLSWDNNLDAQSYILSYQASDGPIQVEEILSNEHYLLNQEKGKSYIWQVNCNCGIGNTSAIAKNNFSIPADEGTSWLSDPTLTYEGESYPPESETEPSTAPTETVDDTATTDNTTIEESTGDEPASIDIDALLNTPVQILVPAEGQESLPANVPSTLTVLPADATIEALQAALKTKKPLCSGVNAAYSCGNHDNVPQYSGSLVSIGPGDEIAMNSMVLSVVSIDGGGNGEGLIKVPMMGNIKLGVRLSGIQVAEGGCIVGGRAELSGVAVSLLSDKQKAELTKAYNTVTAITQTAIENAGAIAETYNSIADLLKGLAKKNQALLDKINNGEKISQKEIAEIEPLKKIANEKLLKTVEFLKNKLGADGSQSLIDYINDATESTCICTAYLEEKPKKGPNNENADLFSYYDEDCKNCLANQTQKQSNLQQFDTKAVAILNEKMICGCGWSCLITSILDDCEEIANLANKTKESISKKENLDFSSLKNKFLKGKVQIGSTCIENFQFKITTDIPIDPQNRQLLENSILLDNGNINISIGNAGEATKDNIEKTKFVEKWLNAGVKVEKKIVKDNIDNDLNASLRIMEKMASEHKTYSQSPPRSGTSEANKASMDCSEFVSWYLYNLGITNDVKGIYTGVMTSEKDFKKAIGSENLIKIKESKKEETFIPQKGDIFVWRKANGSGHTGIVLDADTEKVTILESIGSSCSADESYNKNNGGDKQCGCTRKAIYKRNGPALFQHDGWEGYFRPVIK